MKREIRIRRKKFFAFLLALILVMISIMPMRVSAVDYPVSGSDYGNLTAWINAGNQTVFKPGDSIILSYGNRVWNVKYLDYNGVQLKVDSSDSRTNTYVIKSFGEAAGENSVNYSDKEFSHWRLTYAYMHGSGDSITISLTAVEKNESMGIGSTLLDNISSQWNPYDGIKVYFGQYNGEPTAFRVLGASTDTQNFVDGSIILDCDSILRAACFDENFNNWGNSSISTWLNGEDYYSSPNVFTEKERAAISSTQLLGIADFYDAQNSVFMDYAAENHIFLLSAKEADTLYGSAGKTTDGTSEWWLRSECTYNGDGHYAGIINSNGRIDYDYKEKNNSVGVSPALNLNLSSVLFISATGMSKASALTNDSTVVANTDGTTYKLTLQDDRKSVSITEGKNVIESADGTITVPYSYTDTASGSGEKVNQISVMITDKAYTDNDASILYYGALQNIKDANGNASSVAESATGTGTFELPSGLTGSLGTDYKVYIIAEHVNTDNTATTVDESLLTDYAGDPAELANIYTSIDEVDITVSAPQAGGSFAQTASTSTAGLATTTPSVVWKQGENEATDKAAYNTTYTAAINIEAATGYILSDSVAIKVNGNTVNGSNVTRNQNGTITITCDFNTAKAKLISITNPSAVTNVANGTAKTAVALGLPTHVTIATEDASVTSAEVTWDLENLAEGTYNSSVLTEQSFKVKGMVTLPNNIVNTDNVSREVTVNVTVNAAPFVVTPVADKQNGTYAQNQSVVLTSSTTGAEIYYTTDGSVPSSTNGTKYTGAISVTGEEGRDVTTTIKAIAVKRGMQDSAVATFTYTISIPDTTRPTAEIRIDTNVWNQFLNTITFGLFFKNTKQVSITATDNVTTNPAIKYYISDSVLSETEINADGIAWENYTGAFGINPNRKMYIYAKVTDEANNAVIINTDGIVVYTDSAQDTANIAYVKNVTEDVTANVVLNGNTVADIKNGSSTLVKGSDYTVDNTGKIVFKNDYLKTLSVATYTLTVSYNPMGETYQSATGNDEPATTDIELTVRNPKLVSITNPSAVTNVANGTAKTAAALGLPTHVTIETEDASVTSAEVTWDLENLAEGTYNSSVLTEQSFKVKGEVTLPNNIVNTDNVSSEVTVNVTVNAAPFVVTPVADKQNGTYAQNQSVELTSSTTGAEIYYTTDGSVPSSTNGTKYTGAISVTGEEGRNVTTTIKAIAVKSGMQDSAVAEFTYTISIPVPKFTVTATAGANGTITPGGAVEVVKGGSKTFTITPNEGYEIDSLKVDGVEVRTVLNYEFNNVTADHTIEVTFKEKEPVRYDILSGGDATYTINVDKSHTVRTAGELNKLVSVEIDGNTVDSKNYTAESGSTIITFNEEYMNSLTIATHTIRFNYTDGFADTTVIIKKKVLETETGEPNAPSGAETGDGTHAGWLFALLMISGCVCAAFCGRKRKSMIEK